MENNGTMDVPSSPSASVPSGSHRNLLIAVVAVVAVALVVGSVFAVTMLSAPAGQGAWLFKGAYANYEGSTSVMGFGFDFSVRLEVLDFNSTHAYILASSNIGSSLGESVQNENATWVSLSDFAFAYAFGDSNVTNSYEANVDVGGLGKRSCMVYEYAIDDGGPMMTVYVDKALQWPVKMAMTMVGEGSISLSMDLALTDTNIPGLR